MPAWFIELLKSLNIHIPLWLVVAAAIIVYFVGRHLFRIYVGNRDAEVRSKDAEIRAKDSQIAELKQTLELSTSPTLAQQYVETKKGLENMVASLQAELNGCYAMQLTPPDEICMQADTVKNLIVGMHQGKDAFNKLYEAFLRHKLGVAREATVEDILQLIRDEGWNPHLLQDVIDGQDVFACPIQHGIFVTKECDETTGQSGFAGSETAEIAALEGLRKARGEEPFRLD